MSDLHKQYPENSVLSEILMNVYADTDDKTVTILYDKTLGVELLGLEYHPPTRELVFVFKPGKKPFGTPLDDNVGAIMTQIKTVTLIQVNTKTKEPVMGLEVPLTLV